MGKVRLFFRWWMVNDEIYIGQTRWSALTGFSLAENEYNELKENNE